MRLYLARGFQTSGIAMMLDDVHQLLEKSLSLEIPVHYHLMGMGLKMFQSQSVDQRLGLGRLVSLRRSL